MNFSKKSIALVGIAGLLIITAACNKYVDGPKFSLLTKKSRISNEWVVEKATYNTTDYKPFFDSLVGANFVLEIEKDGVYRTEGKYPDKGNWELGEDKDDVRFKSNEPNSQEESYRITRLTKDQLWMKRTLSNGDQVYFEYKSKD